MKSQLKHWPAYVHTDALYPAASSKQTGKIARYKIDSKVFLRHKQYIKWAWIQASGSKYPTEHSGRWEWASDLNQV